MATLNESPCSQVITSGVAAFSHDIVLVVSCRNAVSVQILSCSVFYGAAFPGENRTA
jgi:hypothetical protein